MATSLFHFALVTLSLFGSLEARVVVRDDTLYGEQAEASSGTTLHSEDDEAAGGTAPGEAEELDKGASMIEDEPSGTDFPSLEDKDVKVAVAADGTFELLDRGSLAENEAAENAAAAELGAEATGPRHGPDDRFLPDGTHLPANKMTSGKTTQKILCDWKHCKACLMDSKQHLGNDPNKNYLKKFCVGGAVDHNECFCIYDTDKCKNHVGKKSKPHYKT